ncbi:replication protein A 70 kDa DNA-binding subunit B [Tanacetum coccineum]
MRHRIESKEAWRIREQEANSHIIAECLSIVQRKILGYPHILKTEDKYFGERTIASSKINVQGGNRVQATVRNQDIKKFQPILDEGACYRISNFGIDENGGNIPLLDHRYKLSFFKNTALTRVGIFDSNPRGFRFEHFGAFTSRKISERELCDVIGTIVSISDAIPFNYVGVDKISRTVILEDFE